MCYPLPGAYPELFALIGAKTPDYRGEFLRGHDAGRGIDPGRTIGSQQADELRSHTHRPRTVFANWVAGGNAVQWQHVYLSPGFGATELREREPTSASGGAETRPRNVAVRYFIRARL